MQDNKVCHHPLPLSLYSRAGIRLSQPPVSEIIKLYFDDVIISHPMFQQPVMPDIKQQERLPHRLTPVITFTRPFPRPAISSSKYFLRSNIILEYFFDIGITFYTAKRMILSQKPAQSMEKLRLPSKNSKT